MLSLATRLRRLAGKLTRGIVTCILATGGMIVGAIVGVLAGFVNEDGLIQGTLIGAISGAFIAMEVVDSLAKIWCCEEYSVATRARLMILVFWNLVIDRLTARTSVFPNLTRVLDSQMNAMPSRHRAEMNAGGGDLFDRTYPLNARASRLGLAEINAAGDLFDRSYPVVGMCRAAVDEIPVIKLTAAQTIANSCPICLHDFKAGESARRLPACCHIFHLVCIDNWLMWHAQCPM